MWAALLFPALVRGQLKYDEKVWVSFADFRQVTDVAISPKFIYISTSGGVLRWDLYKKVWDSPWVIGRGQVTGIDLRGVLNVDYLSTDDKVAVLTSRGAFLYDPIARYWIPTQHSFTPPVGTEIVQGIFIESPGVTVTGRNYFLQGRNAVMDRELHSHALGPFATDDWGFWWLGVNGVGVLQLDSRMLRATMWEMGLYGTDLRAMARGDGWVILGGNNPDGGISLWKEEASLWDHLEPRYNASLQSGVIRDLTTYDHQAYAATEYGVTQFDLRNGSGRTWRLAEGLWSNSTNAVVTDGDTLWVGTENGVNFIPLPKGPAKRVNVEGLKNTNCTRLALDPQALWVGTDLGLFRLDRASGEGGYMDEESGVGGPVTALFSGATEIWAGRYTGLQMIKKGDSEQAGFPTQAFFGGAMIFAVLPVDSLVFVGTDHGLWKYDRYRNRWHQYQKEDGLISNRVFSLLQDGDYILIGTAEGVTRFYWNDPSRVD
jgi:hypothetical protein